MPCDDSEILLLNRDQDLVWGLPRACPEPRVQVVYLGGIPRKFKRVGKLGFKRKEL